MNSATLNRPTSSSKWFMGSPLCLPSPITIPGASTNELELLSYLVKPEVEIPSRLLNSWRCCRDVPAPADRTSVTGVKPGEFGRVPGSRIIEICAPNGKSGLGRVLSPEVPSSTWGPASWSLARGLGMSFTWNEWNLHQSSQRYVMCNLLYRMG